MGAGLGVRGRAGCQVVVEVRLRRGKGKKAKKLLRFWLHSAFLPLSPDGAGGEAGWLDLPKVVLPTTQFPVKARSTRRRPPRVPPRRL